MTSPSTSTPWPRSTTCSRRIKEAASNGATLIVFPELHIPGYCHFAIDLTKGPEYTSIWAEYLRHGIEVPSEETDLLCKAARQANANVVIGINERDKKYGGRQYNSILYINNRGEILGVHRKINITVQELMIHTRGDGGQNLRVHDMDFGKVSGLICGEHDQPLLKQYYIVQGTKVNCSLWPGYLGGAEELPWVTPAMTTAMAVSGACWCVLAANYIPPEKRPDDFYPNTDFYQSFGGSAIINPFGEVVAGPVRDQETIVYADIDLKLNEMARGIINITGLYSRWDILSLLVRENEYEPTGADGVGGGGWPAAGPTGNGAALPRPTCPAASRLPTAGPLRLAALRARVEELESSSEPAEATDASRGPSRAFLRRPLRHHRQDLGGRGGLRRRRDAATARRPRGACPAPAASTSPCRVCGRPACAPRSSPVGSGARSTRGANSKSGLAKVEAVRRLCDDHPADLFLARRRPVGERVQAGLHRRVHRPRRAPAAAGGADPGDRDARIAIIASLEGADPLQGEVDNLAVFYRAGVRLLTLAWGDNDFCGSVHGDGRRLTPRGVDLVAACEEQRVLVDVSHASDQAFVDICRVATRPFVASHSNCRSLCPSPRNLTDDMIRAMAERGRRRRDQPRSRLSLRRLLRADPGGRRGVLGLGRRRYRHGRGSRTEVFRGRSARPASASRTDRGPRAPGHQRGRRGRGRTGWRPRRRGRPARSDLTESRTIRASQNCWEAPD